MTSILKSVFTCLILLLFSQFLSSQALPANECATDHLWDLATQRNPALLQSQQSSDNYIFQQLNRSPNGVQRAGGPDTIPVVVHVIHNGGAANIPANQVFQALQHLNAAFANQFPFGPNTGAPVNIQFCLANRDPAGNPSNGIIRVQSSLTNVTMETQDLDLKNLSRWDPNRYINVWVVDQITSVSMGSGVAGYATLPGAHGLPADGIVNEANYFGTSPSSSKVLVHELGHYLGLYHTFQGGCTNNNCMTDGDQVCDTPPDNSTTAINCGASVNTCSSDEDDTSVNNPFRPVSLGGLGDQPDMVNNYMDYGYLLCQNAFTTDQAARMEATLAGPRMSLLSSDGCTDPCLTAINPGFTSSATSVSVGATVSFTNTTTGGINYDWLIDGVSFSTTQNASYTFTSQGSFVISLEVTNADPGCMEMVSETITVTCPEIASFTASASNVPLGTPAQFTNTSTGGSLGFEWLADGISQSTSTNFSFTPNSPGGTFIQLIANGPTCSDTSLGFFLSAGACLDKSHNVWVFGEARSIDFNNGSPTIGPTVNPLFFAYEGCASISDTSGALMIYSDGTRVFNRNHQLMLNGDGLIGGISPTQGVTIFPKPGNQGLYSVFTLTDEWPDYELSYSEIDMSLDGGLGGVTIKNQLVSTLMAEKNIFIDVPGQDTVWVLTHATSSNAFYAWPVTVTGIGNPVISNVGSIHPFILQSSSGGIGQMKFSPDGKRLAVAINGTLILEIFDFDVYTGQVSNPITLPPFGPRVYGVEFSPNGKLLYASCQTHTSGAIRQFDLSFGNANQIWNSRVDLPTINAEYHTQGGLQLAPDGRIYHSLANQSLFDTLRFMGVVQNPNVLGLGCNYIEPGFSFSDSAETRWGLPYKHYPFAHCLGQVPLGPDTVCANSNGITYTLPPPCQTGVIREVTVTGQATILSSTDTTVTLGFQGSGLVRLTMKDSLQCGVFPGQLDIEVLPSDTTLYLGPDHLICAGANLVLDAGTGYASYLWQDGSVMQTFNAIGPGTYWCTVSGGSQCRPSDTLVLTAGPSLSANLGPDLVLCEGEVATLDPGPGYASYSWQDGSPFQQFTAWLPGTYWVTVTDSACQGSVTDTLEITHFSAALVNLGPDTVICPGDSMVLNAGVGWSSVLWSDSSNWSTLYIGQPGTYHVEVLDSNGCLGRDTIEVAVCVGIFDTAGSYGFTYWPNPVSEELHLRVQLEEIGPVELTLVNPLGQALLRESLYPDILKFEHTLDLGGLAKGVYIVELHSRNHKWRGVILLARE